MLRYCNFSWTSHSYVMPRYCRFSWTLHSYVMLRYCNFFWTFHSYVMLRAWKAAAERRGIPVQSVAHQVKNFTSEGPKMFRGVSNIAGTQTFDRPWNSLKDFLPAHMVLKHKERGHSTLHPSVTSVTQYVFMWYWRSSLESPDPQRFLEELEALLWPKDD